MTATPESTMNPDPAAGESIIDRLAGCGPGTALAALRAQRPEVTRAAERCSAALLDLEDTDGLYPEYREAIGLRVAELIPDPALADWHHARFRELVAADEPKLNSLAMPPALVGFTDHLTLSPNNLGPDAIEALKEAKFGPAAIVTITQLIGFLAFKVRLLAALRRLGDPVVVSAPSHPWRGPVPGDHPRHPFTLEELGWRPWLETVDDLGPTAEQAALVAEVTPRPSARPYYALLAHDIPVLRERTALMRASMYAPGGLRRADRELGAVAASRFNGCAYCASVHARLHIQLTKSEATVRPLLDRGLAAPLADRDRAIVDYAVTLTRAPADLTTAHLAALRHLGLSDLEILDLTHAVAMFAWANRLLQSLGEPVPVAPGG